MIRKIVAATLILIYIIWIAGTWGRPEGERIASLACDKFPESDFLCFYAASSLVMSGTPTAVYDARLVKREATLSQGKDFCPRPFWYPPTYLLITLPLALFPFLFSLTLWGLVTLGGFLSIIKRIFPHPLTIWGALAFPATFQNLVRGQNGFLSVIFMGGGLLLLERAPFIGGFLLGVMTFKPTLAILIPVALLAGRHWRALGGATVSAISMALISLVVFGPGTWLAYIRQLPLIAANLTPDFCFEYNTTTYALAGCLGSPELAKILQWLVMGLVVLAVTWAWFRKGSLPNQGSILILGMLLFSPYSLVYDLTLLALPIAWMGYQGVERGWLPGEMEMMVLGWFLPFFSIFLAFTAKVQIAPIVLAGLFLLSMRRLFLERNQGKILRLPYLD